MSTTLATLRKLVSEAQGDFYTADTTGAGSTTTIVDTGLKNEVNGGDDDAFEHWYVKITKSGHGAVGEVRRVSTYANSTGTLTLQSALTATSGAGTAYELHRINPNDKDAAIKRGLSRLYPVLYRHVIDETLVVDNWLLNTAFETFSGGFTNWTAVGTPTVTAETTIVMHGTQSAKVVAGGSAGQLTQAPHLSVREMTGKGVRAKRWCYATAANTVRIRLDWDGSSFENSSYHSGADQWELLEVTGDVPASATQVKMICEVAASGTGYFSSGFLEVESWPIDRYDIPSTIIDGPHFVSVQEDEDDPIGTYIKILSAPTSGRLLRIEGMGALSSPASDSGTTEVDEPRVELVVAAALYRFNLMMAERSATQDRTRYLQSAEMWKGEMDVLSIRLKMPEMAAEVAPRGTFAPQWHTEMKDGSKVLVFDRNRRTSQGFSRL